MIPFKITLRFLKFFIMKSKSQSNIINSWETIRFELFNTRVCDLGLKIKDSVLEAPVNRLLEEVKLKQLKFQPQFYLTDSWGCPNEIPAIGIPFYLADKRLSRIEEEQTGEIEDEQTVMMFLRHEAGHAFNYAYRLWELPEWKEIFGSFTTPYRDTFYPNPLSRQFVQHIFHSQYGRTYAQKHPDEDFAETFAVWLTPDFPWKQKYRYWPALKKLEYVAELMKKIKSKDPVNTQTYFLNPVENMTMLLAAHYGQRTERYRDAAQGYIDDKLKEIFPSLSSSSYMNATTLLKNNKSNLIARIIRWSNLEQEDLELIFNKIISRTEALSLRLKKNESMSKLLDLTALTTSLAMDFGYTGRLSK